MKTLLSLNVLLLLAPCLLFAGENDRREPPAQTAAATEIRHRFLAMDFWYGKIHYVDQFDASRNWDIACGGGVQDMQMYAPDRLLFTKANGFSIVDLKTQKVIQETRVAELATITTAWRMSDGRTLLGANRKEGVTIFELSPDVRVLSKTVFPQLQHLRVMRPTSQGTLLLAVTGGAAEVTIKADVPEAKRLIRQFKTPKQTTHPYMTVRMNNDHTLVAGGDAPVLFEYAADGTLLRELIAPQPPGKQNTHYAGVHVMANGNVVQANWLGHNAKDRKQGWSLMEFDPSGKVVWYWDPPVAAAGSINNIIVLQ